MIIHELLENNIYFLPQSTHANNSMKLPQLFSSRHNAVNPFRFRIQANI